MTIPGAPGDGCGGQSAASGFVISNIGHDYRIGVYEITNDRWNKFKASLGVPVAGVDANLGRVSRVIGQP